MSPLELLPTLQRRPFDPFRIIDSDGKEYEIRHPEMVMVFPTCVLIATPNPAAPGSFLTHTYLSMYHMKNFEPIGASEGNGAPEQ